MRKRDVEQVQIIVKIILKRNKEIYFVIVLRGICIELTSAVTFLK